MLRISGGKMLHFEQTRLVFNTLRGSHHSNHKIAILQFRD